MLSLNESELKSRFYRLLFVFLITSVISQLWEYF